MINLLKVIKDKDEGYDLAGIGVQFGLYADKPCEFLDAVQKKYLDNPAIPDDLKTFEHLIRPIIKYMAETFHPHMKLIIDGTSAEIVEAKMAVNTNDYLGD